MRLSRAFALATALTLLPSAAQADHLAPEADFRQFKDWAWFALGAASGFVGHEFGHVMADFAFGKSIRFTKVTLGPFPFFAIQPCCNLTHQEMWVIGSAGFVAQDINSELIFWLAPRLRSKRHAFLKGVLILDIALSLGYAITGLAGIGPDQSDVNTMARGAQVEPWKVGIWLIVPAVVDFYRYLMPDSKWAPWISIQGKLTLLGASFFF